MHNTKLMKVSGRRASQCTKHEQLDHPPPCHLSLRRRGKSSTALTCLATLVGSSLRAHCSPLGVRENNFSASRRNRDANVSVRTPRETDCVSKCSSNPTEKMARRKRLSDKYERGKDGRWYKAEKYSLYGSTISSACPCPPPSHSYDDVGGPSYAPLPTPEDVVPHPEVLNINNLPNGWAPVPTKRTSGQNTLILSLSLVLAFCICALMTTCILWRRKKLRHRCQEDVEMRQRKGGLEGQGGAIIQETKLRLKRKFWARATIRWRTSAQARQRKRRVPRSLAHISHSLDRAASLHHITHEASPVPSPTSSSLPNVICARSTQRVVGDFSTPNSLVITKLPSSSLTASGDRASPPTYIQSGEMFPNDSGIPLSSLNPTRELGIPHAPLSGHIAIDDKATLAQMAGLVSAPPNTMADGQEPSFLCPSVPIWQDEELADLDVAFSQVEGSPRSTPDQQASVLRCPPPPLGTNFIPYSHCLPHLPGELDPIIDHVAVASLFEAGVTSSQQCQPSAPPLDEIGAEPSAPLMEDGLEEGSATSHPEIVNSQAIVLGLSDVSAQDCMTDSAATLSSIHSNEYPRVQ